MKAFARLTKSPYQWVLSPSALEHLARPLSERKRSVRWSSANCKEWMRDFQNLELGSVHVHHLKIDSLQLLDAVSKPMA